MRRSCTAIRVLGQRYRVRWRKMPRSTFGRCNFRRQRITLNTKLTREQAISTVIHETLHVLNEAMQIGLAHSQIRQLESGLYAVLHDNGHVME